MLKKFTFDANLKLANVGAAITASAEGKIGSTAKILDVGLARVDARAVIDVSALNVSAAANKYTFSIQGSNSATFATIGANLGQMVIGHKTATGNAAANTVGRYEVQFTNEQDGVLYRYIRLYTTIAGSPVSITFTANVAKQ